VCTFQLSHDLDFGVVLCIVIKLEEGMCTLDISHDLNLQGEGLTSKIL